MKEFSSKEEREARAREIIAYLNELVFLDPKAVNALVEIRLPCNEALAKHPTCQVCDYYPDGPLQVGLLGVLNGLCGVQGKDEHNPGWGYIGAYYDNDLLQYFFLMTESNK